MSIADSARVPFGIRGLKVKDRGGWSYVSDVNTLSKPIRNPLFLHEIRISIYETLGSIILLHLHL
ncbi:hypothetical protein WN55_10506 [Dufourea novaeangliae]|uniref:Uncharacterized protein n=1 Tax=Dufourea novaeangliae TaxID=178035 RepID=A0A154P3T1_DUFNO|nr:hypothetical protein WN55_10506 [Dufourea novaeangliae]